MSFLDKLFGKKEIQVENNIERKVETKTNKVEPMPRDQFFDLIMNVCDWDRSGDDAAVLKPLIDHLSKESDEVIFSFEETMTELLYELDTKENMERAVKCYPHSDDTFLYSRCVALINGKQYFEEAKAGKRTDLWTSEFEAVLYVARSAWSVKNGKDMNEFPYFSKLSYETGSNKADWN